MRWGVLRSTLAFHDSLSALLFIFVLISQQICVKLWCEVPAGSGKCKTGAVPAADGTNCGENKVNWFVLFLFVCLFVCCCCCCCFLLCKQTFYSGAVCSFLLFCVRFVFVCLFVCCCCCCCCCCFLLCKQTFYSGAVCSYLLFCVRFVFVFLFVCFLNQKIHHNYQFIRRSAKSIHCYISLPKFSRKKTKNRKELSYGSSASRIIRMHQSRAFIWL